MLLAVFLNCQQPVTINDLTREACEEGMRIVSRYWAPETIGALACVPQKGLVSA
jgi:hypothetical protein